MDKEVANAIKPCFLVGKAEDGAGIEDVRVVIGHRSPILVLVIPVHRFAQLTQAFGRAT